MSKLTRSGLKSIVKECLLEILSDGLSSTIQETVTKKKKQQIVNQTKESISREQDRKRIVNDSISYATSDPVLRSVLEHTASTTLKEQNSAERRAPTLSNQSLSFGDDPSVGPGLNIEGMFNENWAAMAFPGEK